MSLALALLTLLTGTTKSATVCGINSAAVARPAAGGSRPGIFLYAFGLYVGALALVLVLKLAGQLFLETSGLGSNIRAILAAIALLVLGAIEARRGPLSLPHIAWAVPSSWAVKLKSEPFLLFFGLIRGIAIFNHSPYASMHAWLIVVFLLPQELESPLMAAVFAAGLALWSFAYALRSAPLRRSSTNTLPPLVGLKAIRASNMVARFDATALAVLALLVLAAQ